MLSQDDIREQLSIAYLHAVAAHAGYAWEPTRVDRDGIDGRVCARGIVDPLATISSPSVAFQLKATTTISESGDPIRFPLKQKNYDDLRGRYAEPRYLAVLLLPAAFADWLHLDASQLVLRRCMYWRSLAGSPETGNTTSTTVEIPRANLLDVSALQRLMAAAAQEGSL